MEAALMVITGKIPAFHLQAAEKTLLNKWKQMNAKKGQHLFFF